MEFYETTHGEPRDSLDDPIYRIQFWERFDPSCGWNLQSWLLGEAQDVTEVLKWATLNARGRLFEVFVETEVEEYRGYQIPRTCGYIKIYGINPNES
ncbi:hypothetical protein [Glutamicibacter sp. NPDC127525]|uniref:hypothetical protein n=1 Tax=unclassified Glutamicibacter TaxID=2627139 RepID=UPI0036303384